MSLPIQTHNVSCYKQICLLFFTLVYLLPSIGFSQITNEIDSLEKVLAESEDVNKFEILIKLATTTSKDSASANNYLNQALALAKRLNDPHRIAKSYMELGYVAQDNFSYKNSDKYFDLADSIFEELQDYKGMGDVKKDKGRSLLEQSYFDQCLALFRQALLLYQKAQDTVSTYYANYAIGYSHYGLRDYDSAIYYFFKIIPFCSSNQEGVCPDMYNQLGTTYGEIGEPAKSMKYLKLAYELYLNKGDTTLAANSLMNMAGTYFFQNKMDSCTYFLNKSVKFYEQTGNLKGELLGVNNMAAIYKETGEILKATTSTLKASRLAKKLNDRSNIATSYINIFDLYGQQKQFKLAEIYADSAYQIASTIKSKYFMSQYYLHMTSLRRYQSRYDDAFKMNDLYYAYKDSMLNESKTKQIAELETKYQTEQKDRLILMNQIELSEKQSAIQKQVAIIIFLILIVIVTTFWYSNKRKRQQLLHQVALNSERSRIAMDLHDHLGAELTIISSKLDTSAYKAQKESEKETLTNISDQVRKAGKTLRETVWSIQNEFVDRNQLLQKIDHFAEQLLEGSSIQFLNHSSSDYFTLPPQQALDTYRICQEAITNAHKYAQPSKIELDVRMKNKKLEVQLTDDGHGFDLEKETSGFGLQNIKQRVEKMDGSLSIESSKDSGTKISFQVQIL